MLSRTGRRKEKKCPPAFIVLCVDFAYFGRNQLAMKCIKAVPDVDYEASQDVHNLLDKLNSLPEYCSIHPDFETVLLVSFSSKKETVRVETICCQDFQNRLIQKGLIAR